MARPPVIFDRRLRRAHLERAARAAAAPDFLAARVAADLAERVGLMRRTFPVGLVIGARGGAMAAALIAGGRVERVLDAGARLAIDEERLPFAAASVDLVVAPLFLHWTNDLVGALIQIRRALKPDGLFLAALLGGATLTELRQSLMDAEVEVLGGAGPRVSPFVDGYDAAGLMQRAGFALPVVDIDTLRASYGSLSALVADLRAMGETSALSERPRALTRAVSARAESLYRKRFSGPDGRLAATFEIITLTGWAPHPAQPKPARRGSGRVPLATALKAVAARRKP